jgi:hypothetical protein
MRLLGSALVDTGLEGSGSSIPLFVEPISDSRAVAVYTAYGNFGGRVARAALFGADDGAVQALDAATVATETTIIESASIDDACAIPGTSKVAFTYQFAPWLNRGVVDGAGDSISSSVATDFGTWQRPGGGLFGAHFFRLCALTSTLVIGFRGDGQGPSSWANGVHFFTVSGNELVRDGFVEIPEWYSGTGDAGSIPTNTPRYEIIRAHRLSDTQVVVMAEQQQAFTAEGTTGLTFMTLTIGDMTATQTSRTTLHGLADAGYATSGRFVRGPDDALWAFPGGWFQIPVDSSTGVPGWADRRLITSPDWGAKTYGQPLDNSTTVVSSRAAVQAITVAAGTTPTWADPIQDDDFPYGQPAAVNRGLIAPVDFWALTATELIAVCRSDTTVGGQTQINLVAHRLETEPPPPAPEIIMPYDGRLIATVTKPRSLSAGHLSPLYLLWCTAGCNTLGTTYNNPAEFIAEATTVVLRVRYAKWNYQTGAFGATTDRPSTNPFECRIQQMTNDPNGYVRLRVGWNTYTTQTMSWRFKDFETEIIIAPPGPMPVPVRVPFRLPYHRFSDDDQHARRNLLELERQVDTRVPYHDAEPSRLRRDVLELERHLGNAPRRNFEGPEWATDLRRTFQDFERRG